MSNFKSQISNLRTLLSRFPVFSRLLIFIGYLIAIVYASLASPRKMPKLMYVPYLDKVVHFLMYTGFCFLGLWVLNTGLREKDSLDGKSNKGWVNYVLISVLAAGWGLFMEMMQRYMHTGRHYSVYDLYANIAGVLLGTGIYFLIVRLK